MSSMLFYDVGLAHVEYDETQEKFRGDEAGLGEAIYEEVQFLCLDTYWRLNDWLQNVPPNKMTTNGNYLRKSIDYKGQDSLANMSRDRQFIYELIAECTLLKGLKNRS